MGQIREKRDDQTFFAHLIYSLLNEAQEFGANAIFWKQRRVEKTLAKKLNKKW